MIPVLKGNILVKIKSQDIHCGDIVKAEINQEIPCDMVVLSTDDAEGKCHVTTANLDGETNLKVSFLVLSD